MTETASGAHYCCPACGCLDDAILDQLAVLHEQLESQRQTIADLQHEVTSKVSQIRRLKGQQAQQLRTHKRYQDGSAMRVLEYWRDTCAPKAKEIDHPKRLRAVLDRLGTYSVEQLMRCADGYALKPFVTNAGRTHDGPTDKRRVDADLIYRDPQHVDTGIAIADQADRLRNVMSSNVDRADTRPGVAALSELGRAAVRLATFGFCVFPVKPDLKVPACRHGLLDAVRDPERISAYWTKVPTANVGVRCGAESGIIVLDVDGDDGWETLHRLEDARGELPKTASVVTPRGGQHFYFLHPGFEISNTTGYPGKCLDIRGDGGYVLAPPSTVGGRRYEPDEQTAIAAMPEWLINALRHRQETAPVGPGRDWAKFITEGAGQGERDNRMTSYVGHMFAHGHDAAEVLASATLLNQRIKPPLTERDLQRIVKSINRKRAKE